MNYTCGEPKECANVTAPVEDLTSMMKETNRMAADVLNLSHRISAHMFGIENPCCEKESDPKCFRDELVKTRCELFAALEELSKICCMLGV